MGRGGRAHLLLWAILGTCAVGSAAGAGVGLGPECQDYLAAKNFATPADLERALPARCKADAAAQQKYAPDPRPSIPGAADTTDLACRYGNPALANPTCCGLRPHFNWIVGTCEPTQATGQFCANLPQCAIDGSPKINYVAAYQFNGTAFVLMDESSVGELSAQGVAGDYSQGTGWEARKAGFRWRGGDWTSKYAPWASGGRAGPSGPRGITPPAGLWILSAENFYYGAFYFLSQLGLNLEGMGNPTGTNCWMWEYDALEGTAGWTPGGRLPGNLNMVYATSNAQVSGCMPIAYTAAQANGLRHNFSFPEDFRAYCAGHPDTAGCSPWAQGQTSWSGGAVGTSRFENLWDEPYVFAVVLDAKGYWVYRWRPTAYSPKPGGAQTGWPGVGRFAAARTLPARPAAVRDPRGLQTDVPGDVPEAVLLHPALSDEAACLRSKVEGVDWQFGSLALGAIAHELGQYGPGRAFEGAQNWWSHFVDTKQNAGYPLSIAGLPLAKMTEQTTCDLPGSFTCACKAKWQNDVSSPAELQERTFAQEEASGHEDLIVL